MLSRAPRIGIVIPVKSQWDYVKAAVSSLLEHTLPRPVVFILDDNSPSHFAQEVYAKQDDAGSLCYHRFSSSGGLTRSLNRGIDMAIRGGCEYIAAVNSDILVPPGWHEPLVAACAAGVLDFAGPLTNAKGTSGTGEQAVQAWYEDYILTDLPTGVAGTQNILRERYAGRTELGAINGFFMFAHRDSWHKVRRDAARIFPSRIETMPSGKKNPTPLMTGQEDWLASRCRELDLKMGVALDSFVFHYRSATRGNAYRTPGWFRIKENDKNDIQSA